MKIAKLVGLVIGLGIVALGTGCASERMNVHQATIDPKTGKEVATYSDTSERKSAFKGFFKGLINVQVIETPYCPPPQYYSAPVYYQGPTTYYQPGPVMVIQETRHVSGPRGRHHH